MVAKKKVKKKTANNTKAVKKSTKKMKNVAKAQKKKDGIHKVVYWAPRVLSIIFIGMILSMTFNKEIGSILMIIPAALLIIFLLIAWHWEKVGSIILIALGFILGVFFDAFKSSTGFMFLVLPVWLIGVLFGISDRLNSK